MKRVISLLLCLQLILTAAPIASLTVGTKTKPEVLATLGLEAGDDLETYFTDGTISLPITDKSRLQAGKSYTLLVDVLAEGCSETAKPVQIKLNFKVMK